MVNRQPVGAHYGLRDWLSQRITAMVMVLYTVLVVALMLQTAQIDFVSWRMLFAPQWMKLATLLFLTSLFPHAWIGVRNVVMDYIKNAGLRLTLYVVTVAWLVACAGWSIEILWSIH